MGIKVTAKVVGLDRAKEQLRQLPKAIRNRAMRRGFSRIGSLIAKGVKSQIHGADAKRRRTGQTKKSIGIRIKIYRTSGNIVVAIGPRSGFTVYVRGTDRIKQSKKLTSEGRAKLDRVAKAIGYRKHVPGKTFHFINTPRRYLVNALNRYRSQLPGIMQDEVRKALRNYASSNG